MNSIKKMEWRYAVKKFDAERILSNTKIQILKEAFNLTATSYGLQPLKMVVVRNKELQKELVAHSYNQEQVSQASHILIICIEKDIDEKYIENYFDRVKKIRDTPDTILDPFRNYLIDSFTKMNADEIKEWATKQAYLALGNLMTICAIEDIDACPMEGFIALEYDRVLNLDTLGIRSILVMPVGYRANDDMFSEFKKVRKDIAESVIEIE
ncbi:MAG: NAD(P)H-dependent oxidoreductase [Cellulophaga sp.]